MTFSHALTRAFLFTDIEGSTRRWESDRAAMSAALARHDAILRRAIEDHDGTVFKTVGDAFCATFASTSNAAAAAIAAQRMLSAENWAAFGAGFAELRVRMAIHVGEAERRDGDWFGPTLNRIARLLAAGHGGQVLVSLAAEQLLRERLPEGAGLVEKGEHRLADLSRPERIYQLTAAQLATRFPPLRAAGGKPGNLPSQSSSFVARESEIDIIRDMLDSGRLITLTGVGGVGKTRLALAAATQLAPEFPDGVWLVDLSPLSDPRLVLPALATVLGLQETPGQTLERVLADALRPRRALVVMDNCEHLIDAAAELAETVLAAGPGMAMIATSRERLAIAAEACLQIEPLPVGHAPVLASDSAAQPSVAETLAQVAAVKLFVDRARSTSSRFSLDETTAPDVAALCVRLDGLPLAIELAASLVGVMTPSEILGRLDERFRLLAGTRRDQLPRQRTLSAAIDWSHDLLSDIEQRLFRRLAVFRGGWSVEAAESVCAGPDLSDWQVLPLLAQLVDKSLVVAGTAGRETRYHFLETLRHYALDRLEAAGEHDVLRDRHLAWCSTLASAAAAELEGPRQAEWLHRVSSDLDNLRAALDHSYRTTRAELGLCIAADMGHWWYQRGRPSEARQRLEALLTAAGTEAPARVRARAWRVLGAVAMYQGDHPAAGRFFDAAAETIGSLDAAELTRAQAQQAWQAWTVGDRARLVERWQTAASRIGPDSRAWDRGLVAMVGVIAAGMTDDLALALERGRESLEAFETAGDAFYTSVALNNLGWTMLLQGRAEEAVTVLQQGQALAEDQGYLVALENVLESLGRAAREAGQPALARDSLRRALELMRQQGHRLGLAICLQHLAALELDAERAGSAAELLGACESVLLDLGQSPDYADPVSRASLIAALRDALGPARADTSMAIGRALDVDMALDHGLEVARATVSRGTPDDG